MLSQLSAVVLPVLLVAGIGFTWAKIGRRFDSVFLTDIATNVGTPCLVAHSLMTLEIDTTDLAQMGVAVLTAIAGFLISGITNTASVSLADSYVLPSVAAAVIGGTSIFGGRGGYGGTIVGALILTVLTALLTVLGLTEPVRQILFGALIVAVAAAYTRITGET